MSLSERMMAYSDLPDDLCYCGLAKGHVGWLLCAMAPPPLPRPTGPHTPACVAGEIDPECPCERPKTIDEMEAEIRHLETVVPPLPDEGCEDCS